MEQIDVWQVLDRINAVVQHSILTNPSLLQGPESSLVSGLVTVKLGMYEESCGYTKEVSNELFSRKNERKRELLKMSKLGGSTGDRTTGLSASWAAAASA